MCKCELCGQEMLTADGCTISSIRVKGKVYKRIKFGTGAEYGFDLEEGARCHDCGARKGHYHHYGCDVERCPVCHGQFIGCDCDIEFITSEE